MKVGYLQFCPEKGAAFRNRDWILSQLEKIQKGDVDLLVLPELAFSGYDFESVEELLPSTQIFNDSFFDPLRVICRDKNFALVIGFAERECQRIIGEEGNEKTAVLYNSSILIQPNGETQLYRKNHLYGKEKILFSAGNLGFPLFEVKGVRVGLLICFDHMFPEAARTLTLAGAQVICHSCNLVLAGYANITSCSRALENRVYWVLANRYGQENHLVFSGESRIVDPFGTVLNQAPADQDSLFITKIDPKLTKDKGLGTFNHLLGDRRVDSYRL